jgi:hypothetical protein
MRDDPEGKEHAEDEKAETLAKRAPTVIAFSLRHRLISGGG